MNNINKSSKDQADLSPISMSNLSNSSFQEQEEIKPEIINNINLEGKWKMKAGRDRKDCFYRRWTIDLSGVLSNSPLYSAVFSDNLNHKISVGEASAEDKHPIRWKKP